MKIYDRPFYYTIIHLFFGFIAVWYPFIGFLALLYQLGQLIYNVRIFPIEMKIRKGNSIAHTTKKLFEMLIGFIIGTLIKKTIG